MLFYQYATFIVHIGRQFVKIMHMKKILEMENILWENGLVSYFNCSQKIIRYLEYRSLINAEEN